MAAREYALPDGGTLPLHSLAAWCQDCSQLEDMENLNPNQWLTEIATVQQQIASVERKKSLCEQSWTHAYRFFGHLERGQVTNETFSKWAKELNQALIGFRVISDRNSPARCLTCGGTRVVPAEYSSDADTPGARKLIHSGCGGVLESVIAGDIYIANRTRRVRRYSLDGDFLGWFEDDSQPVAYENWNFPDPWYQRIINYFRKKAD